MRYLSCSQGLSGALHLATKVCQRICYEKAVGKKPDGNLKGKSAEGAGMLPMMPETLVLGL